MESIWFPEVKLSNVKEYYKMITGKFNAKIEKQWSGATIMGGFGIRNRKN